MSCDDRPQMAAFSVVDDKQHVLVVGATGRTGRQLVERLAGDPRFAVSALVRDPEKAQLIFGCDREDIDLVHGDLQHIDHWKHELRGCSAVVTAVSSGMATDPLVSLGVREEPSNAPSNVDAAGLKNLAAACKDAGVGRVVCVSTAFTDNPWAPAAIFLNLVRSCVRCCSSIHRPRMQAVQHAAIQCAHSQTHTRAHTHKHARCPCKQAIKYKWYGEQAIRTAGVDYMILRPHGLIDNPPRRDTTQPEACRGIAFAQPHHDSAEASPWPARLWGASTRRTIGRDDLALLCHEALCLQPPPGHTRIGSATVECWSTAEHGRPMVWSSLVPDPPGPLP